MAGIAGIIISLLTNINNVTIQEYSNSRPPKNARKPRNTRQPLDSQQHTRNNRDMNYTITDQRELLRKDRPEDEARYGFVLKYWKHGDENTYTRITFPSQQEAEEYLILNTLSGTLI